MTFGLDIWLAILLTFQITSISSALSVVGGKPTIDLNSCPGRKTCANSIKEGRYLNIHLVPHSHDDVGWLKTVDQYYYGTKKSITSASVEAIIDSVIDSLQRDERRRFIMVEMAFLKKWWKLQNQSRRDALLRLIMNGQIEIANGGWVMNDEGAAHYTAIIDQMTLGFEFIADLVNNDTALQCIRPRTGWQIDPFGHSYEQANLFRLMGFDAIFMGRISEEDKYNRIRKGEMQMAWSTSKSNILNTVLYNGYNPPDGFCFDILCKDELVVDDKSSPEYNVDVLAEKFVTAINKWARAYQDRFPGKTMHILVPMGTDFMYMNADSWFNSMDKMINYINKVAKFKKISPQNINVLYSTPACYADAVSKAQSKTPLSLKEGDFFPYASSEHAYWTGYFTSRPSFKGMIRESNGLLQSTLPLATLRSGLHSVRSKKKRLRQKVELAREAVATMQHHDAVTGTAKQAVTDDYTKQLAASMVNLGQVISQSLGGEDLILCSPVNTSVYFPGYNATIVLYNPLARPLTTHVRIPTPLGPNLSIFDENGTEVLSQSLRANSNVYYAAVFDVHFPLGLSTQLFTIKAAGQEVPQQGARNYPSSAGTSMSFKIEVAYYESMTRDHGQPSGAYIFRPANSTAKIVDCDIVLQITGPVVDENHWTCEGGIASYVVRMFKTSPDVEVEWTAGPLPDEDGIGKELVFRYKFTDFDWDANEQDITFYTDSAGRRMMRREVKRITRRADLHPRRPLFRRNNLVEPVARSYYPVNTRISIESGNKRATVLTDRSQGGTSLEPGVIELMVHRRMFQDDGYGVNEALNEEQFGRGLVVRGKHTLLFDSRDKSASDARSKMKAQEIFQPVIVGILKAGLNPSPYKLALLNHNLPEEIHLLTLADRSPSGAGSQHWLLRLENIMNVSQPITVDLKDLFAGWTVTKATEMGLGADVEQRVLNATMIQWPSEEKISNHDDDNNNSLYSRADPDQQFYSDYYESTNYPSSQFYNSYPIYSEPYPTRHVVHNHILTDRLTTQVPTTVNYDKCDDIEEDVAPTVVTLQAMEIKTWILDVSKSHNQ